MSYLYGQITQYEFSDLFAKRGRSETFSYRARIALFEYLNDLALDTGSPIEIDVVEICCEWTEYPNITVAAQECGYEDEDEDEDEDAEDEMLEYLRDRTQIIEFAGGLLVQDF